MSREERFCAELDCVNNEIHDVYMLIIAGLGGQEYMFDPAAELCSYVAEHVERLVIEGRKIIESRTETA